MPQHYKSVKEHYKFLQQDIDQLVKLKPYMQEVAEEFIEGFYNYIWDFGETAKFLTNSEIIARHRVMIKQWFLNLFSGTYDINYFMNLYKIGEIHVKIGLPTHYVNAAFTYVRLFVSSQIENYYVDEKDYANKLKAAEKIIDINLDVLTSSYREEELSKFLSMSKFEKSILSSLKKFTSYINFLLAGALALVAFFAIGLFCYDVYLLFFSDIGIEKGILTVLGSLLVLWAAIELIHEEIKHLQGKGFAIGAFIMLAMAALIRKVLIYSLSGEKTNELLVIAIVIVGLAIAYWLVGTKKREM
ncbi:MAG: phosphate-starvation-inducible PsiE family protein [Epsilonproteobacteria bacterium]|nr:phosphate-starvation-inducible PsiE family protein [Campylobacterota bacterium]